MKKIVTIFICFLSSFLVAEEKIPFNFTVVPGVNLIPGEHNTMIASGLVSSEVYGVTGLQLGPVYSTVESDMNGFQVSGVFNSVKGDSNGLQAAGVYNYNGGNFNSVQLSGVFNIVEGERVNGFQAAGVYNSSNNVNGCQLAGVFNKADLVNGVQIGGAFNKAESINLLQLSGAVNIAEVANGLQIAGAANIIKHGSGLQLSGAVNIAKEFNGLQIGVVNIVSGSSKGSVPIGVINLYQDGIFDVAVWMDDKGILYTGLETGNKYFYTQIYTGNHHRDKFLINNRISGAGLGYRFFPDSIINFDIVTGAKFEVGSSEALCENNWAPEVKTSASLKLGPLAITGGVMFNLMIDGYNENASFFKDKERIKIDRDLDAYYNYFAGVKLSF